MWRVAGVKGGELLPVLIAGLTPFLVIVLLVTATGLSLVAWRPPVLWSDTFGSSSKASSVTVIESGDSGFFVEGYVNSSSFARSGGGGYIFLSKYDPDGKVVWSHTIGNTSNALITWMSVGSDGLYLTGSNQSGGIVLKYDLNGNLVWTREFGATEAEASNGIIYASSSDVYLASSANPMTNQSFTGIVKFVREYDLAGDVVWTSEFSNDSSGTVTGLYAASSGVYVLGEGQLPGQPPSSSGYLVKFDLSGNQVWARQLTNELANDGRSAITGDPSGVYVTYTSSGFQGSLSKYDFNGNLDWSIQYGSPDDSGVSESRIAMDSSGVYVSMSSVAGREFLMKYDFSGGQVWSFQMAQPPAQDEVSGTAFRLTTSSGSLFVAGAVRNEIGPGYSVALVADVNSSASLVFFGVNPPLSFLILGVLVAAAVSGLLVFRRLRRRMRPRVVSSQRSLPARD
jgi:hypothetical protein